MSTQHDVRLIDGLAPGVSPEPYLPAAGKTWLLPLYDPMTRLGGVRRRHARVVEHDRIAGSPLTYVQARRP